jgi:hypothetical protein
MSFKVQRRLEEAVRIINYSNYCHKKFRSQAKKHFENHTWKVKHLYILLMSLSLSFFFQYFFSFKTILIYIISSNLFSLASISSSFSHLIYMSYSILNFSFLFNVYMFTFPHSAQEHNPWNLFFFAFERDV